MNILVIGANSDIAQALIKELLQDGSHELILTSRNTEQLKSWVQKMNISNTPVSIHFLDVIDINSHDTFLSSLEKIPDCVIYAAGYLGNNESHAEAMQIMQTNYTGAISLLGLIANKMASTQKEGLIVGLSSVAGVRGRGSNHIYGSAKAGFTTYLSGLRARLSKTKIHVLTVILGFVNTKMTHGKDFPNILSASPEQVAKSIYHSMKKRQNVLYTPVYWRLISLVLNVIPESIFKRLRF